MDCLAPSKVIVWSTAGYQKEPWISWAAATAHTTIGHSGTTDYHNSTTITQSATLVPPITAAGHNGTTMVLKQQPFMFDATTKGGEREKERERARGTL